MISASDESENVSLVNQVLISAGFKMAGQSAFLTNTLARTIITGNFYTKSSCYPIIL